MAQVHFPAFQSRGRAVAERVPVRGSVALQPSTQRGRVLPVVFVIRGLAFLEPAVIGPRGPALYVQFQCRYSKHQESFCQRLPASRLWPAFATLVLAAPAVADRLSLDVGRVTPIILEPEVPDRLRTHPSSSRLCRTQRKSRGYR